MTSAEFNEQLSVIERRIDAIAVALSTDTLAGLGLDTRVAS